MEQEKRITCPERGEIVLRPLHSAEDFDRCVALQKETWGEDFTEVVPPSLLMVSQKLGGVAVGAFDPAGRLLGFVFGMTGVEGGRMIHWSDMLAVRPECRGAGLGRQLKLTQRERLLELGVGVMRWSCDPLEAANAHLNINRLGARPIEYLENMYGETTGSTRHAGIGTDRFIVEWDLTGERVQAAIAERRSIDPAIAAGVPVVNTSAGTGDPLTGSFDLPDLPSIRVEIPADIQGTKTADPQAARAWRACTRHTFRHYLEAGYAIEGFLTDALSGRCFYFLSRIVNTPPRPFVVEVSDS